MTDDEKLIIGGLCTAIVALALFIQWLVRKIISITENSTRAMNDNASATRESVQQQREQTATWNNIASAVNSMKHR